MNVMKKFEASSKYSSWQTLKNPIVEICFRLSSLVVASCVQALKNSIAAIYALKLPRQLMLYVLKLSRIQLLLQMFKLSRIPLLLYVLKL
jgi:hypothetical protein